MTISERHSLDVRIGLSSETGRRARNEDYAATLLGSPSQIAARGVAAAVADGVGGHKGGREAAETAVRAFLDAYGALPETLGPQRAAARALESVNSWIYAQGRADPMLAAMACTFSSLILRRRSAHVVHVGDSRVYRLGEAGLEQLTTDHVLGRGELAHALLRAIGFEDSIRLDHAVLPLRMHDRFLLCSDGVHGSLDAMRLRQLLAQRDSPQETAALLTAAALDAGASDNVTALVIDVVDLPPADRAEIAEHVALLRIGDLPSQGDTVDGYKLGEQLSDGRYSRLFHATDTQSGRAVVVKFPHPRVATEHSYRLAFVREAWVAARVASPWIGEILAPTENRQTRLYSVMPFYDGETLEQRLKRAPPVSLAEGVSIATRLARAAVTLHRAGIVHRDIKPDNVILEKAGGLRLIDLGVARVPQLEEFPVQDVPGTASYMAPEQFEGAAGDEKSDLFALGVTMYRVFARAYPYGEVEPFSRPRFAKAEPLSRYRADLPAWLDAALARATAVKPADRHGDVLEFAFECENGALRNPPVAARKRSLHERNPLRFWQAVSALLFIALVVSLARR